MGGSLLLYDYIHDQYDMAVKTGKVSAFMQELMLRITSEEERLVQEAEIRWYKRATLFENPGAYNFYITTDFATSNSKMLTTLLLSSSGHIMPMVTGSGLMGS